MRLSFLHVHGKDNAWKGGRALPTTRSPDVDKRSEERKLAEQMYLESKGTMKMVDIAAQLHLPDNKIRKWKSMDEWEAKLHPQSAQKVKKKQMERSTKKKGSVPPKKGAPFGNKNAIGNRGNPNPNTRKHGGYSAVYWDTLDEEERELIDDMPQDEEAMLIEQIQLFSVRERRIMQAINKYRQSKEPVVVYGVVRTESKRTFKDKEEEERYNEIKEDLVRKGERMPGNSYDLQTTTDNKDNIIARLESELSNVQAKKTKAIEALAKLHMEQRKTEGGKEGNDVVKAWTERIIAQRRQRNGE